MPTLLNGYGKTIRTVAGIVLAVVAILGIVFQFGKQSQALAATVKANDETRLEVRVLDNRVTQNERLYLERQAKMEASLARLEATAVEMNINLREHMKQGQ